MKRIYINKMQECSYMENGEVVTNKRVIIFEEFLDDDNNLILRVPSALTQVLTKWKKKSLTMAKNEADTIVSFMNYVLEEVEKGDDKEFLKLKDTGIFGLTFYHAQQYLQKASDRGVKLDTLNQYTNRILNLYEVLIEAKLLDKRVKFEYQTYKIKGGLKTVRERINPFKREAYRVVYPDSENVKLTKLVNMDDAYWQLFLKVSEKVEPQITFGITLQIFGGLRRGEVVNLADEDIVKKRKQYIDNSKMMITIQDRSKELFVARNIDISKTMVKKPRKQVVFNFNDKLYEYYEKHLTLRADTLYENNQVTKALFVDKKGQAMSGETYSKKWNKVKREFMKVIEEKVFSEYCFFKEMRWGTHIGRGIFTNLCLKYGLAKNADELRNLRGDSNSASSKAYIDEFKLLGIIIKTFGEIEKNIQLEEVLGIHE